MEDLSLKKAQQMINDWFNELNVGYFSPLTNLGQLTEEVGEVARIMIREYGDQSFKESDKDKDLGAELSDVLFSLLCIANQTNVDLGEAFLRKMDKRKNRDEKRHQNNDKINKKHKKCLE
ncbi:MAG: nucleotide pyrophosphohydrolase [Candidatus Magasanikbacteria bacterium]|jgi:NTP pyrophosphatase (non-canonical NTP hydrolase)|nr:nucleotide pyrophosphohydrolase [Candidatus Magasanikbacteria bacterium]MBT4221117.1 nucleotide pyrophosphohydrolase [Candidatus Magasanikbacteria bacterium]MBT4350313.1 nucleotide pyrophosphohydrolase [Candidatus Magasanikbacteria bacterium]MBT4541739.1 nucleotide pyrophosphohydrolase [Candidatus Magasanikbacteria bacterium]MBT6253284.1 nucleotide pyrophosphohydrolase [Candidatus Magasanikbacteria bacterium]